MPADGGATRPCTALLMLLLLLLLLLLSVTAATAVPTTAAPVNVEANKENYIPVDGGKVTVSYTNGGYLSVRCDRGAPAALDDDALARLEIRTRVVSATFAGCRPPRAGYAAALRRLRVRLLPRASLALELPPGGAPLSAEHLARLELAALRLAAASRRAPPPPLAPRALAGLARLAQLDVRGVPLPRDALEALPPGLAALALADAGAVRAPAPLLRALSGALSADAAVRLEGATSASAVSLTLARGAALDWARFPMARRAALAKWNEAPGLAWRPRAWASCSNVTSLTLVRANFSSLPARWLGACSALEALELSGARALAQLPAALLEGECAARPCAARALSRLLMRYGALKSLPEGLFDPVPNLRYLDLTANELLTLPGGIFARPIKLTTLILAGNKFADSTVYKQFAPLHQLSTLDLSKNRDLPDACSGSDYTKSGLSDLKELKNLTKLNLSSTSVSRICSDWRVDMLNLQELRLHDTRITRLSFDDLQYKRHATLGPKPRIELLGTPVRTISYSVSDEALAESAPPARATVVLSEPLACDCELFRAMRAIRTHVEHVDLAGVLACEPRAAPRLLQGVPLDDMLCPEPELCRALPPGCACAAREQGSEAAPLWHARAACERAALRELPALPATRQAFEWDLRLAGNDIATLDELPPSVRILDLRNNSVVRVSEAAAAVLGGLSALRLAGNPLSCNCSALPLLEAVAALGRSASDALEARCADGRALATAAAARHACRSAPGAAPLPLPLPLLAALGAVLAALALAGLALGLALAQPARRVRLKGLLLRWGWLPRGAEADDARPYDVFVSFAHEDEAAARELAAALEAGAAPLRLCLHSRDWAPGEYIDAQIAASVRCARRTLCVVSRHFCRSRWTRAELREASAAAARDAAPRLVLVLLEDAEALAPLDAELRRCLATCTYLRRDHPRFWQRLREALPKPRAPPAPPAPPAPSPAAA